MEHGKGTTMRRLALRLPAILTLATGLAASSEAQELPFDIKTEVYRQKESERELGPPVMVFALRLEQPFLAGEFEKSNYLRLHSLDGRSYLIYPHETRFEQKHAEFFGRLRGEGTTTLRLTYEMVSENLDGSRKVDVREGRIEIDVPEEPVGPESIYRDWAREQNAHFANLLKYYPDETFFQYVLLQSRDRYGVEPPEFRQDRSDRDRIEYDLYYTFSGGLAVQQALQRETLEGRSPGGELTRHVSELSPPSLRSLPYEELLEKKRLEGTEPRVHAMSRLVPRDQYFLHFNSMSTANQLVALAEQWGTSLLRLFTVSARDHHLREKYEDQLCLRRDGLTRLFADAVIAELGVTGSDFFIAEGTDLTFIFRIERPELFDRAAAGWLEEVRARHPDLVEREFNYRGHRVLARYTDDRTVSSFVVRDGEHVIYSNSHVATRKVIETMIGMTPNLHDALDYRYMTTVLPPAEDPASAYLYGSEAFLRRLVSPAFKIAEKRRLEALNHLVMLNNASLFYRLEHGESPDALSDLVAGRFADLDKLAAPEGGAYAFDVELDTCTNSLYNRLKYLTPIRELEVLRISAQEAEQYKRYRQRYESFWSSVFDPVAIRATVGKTVKLETALLPFANSGLYSVWRDALAEEPRSIGSAHIARTAVASLKVVPGREKVGEFLRQMPGVTEALQADPTLTDLAWIGDRVDVHFCDDDTILEIDLTKLEPIQFFGNVGVAQQAIVATAIAATNLPVYVTVEVEDEEKANRLLELLASRIFLEGGDLGGLSTRLDAYRLAEYRGHAVYVLSYQLYAVKVRLYVSLVAGRLVAATTPATLNEVVDAAAEEASPDAVSRDAHAMARLSFRAMNRLRDDVMLYWEEKARQAAHRNIMPIYTLLKLYDVPIGEVNRLANAKYGVSYVCPGGGEYVYDEERDQVLSTVYGNRRHARQNLALDGDSAFARFFNSLEDITAWLRFTDDGLIATVEIRRRAQ